KALSCCRSGRRWARRTSPRDGTPASSRDRDAHDVDACPKRRLGRFPPSTTGSWTETEEVGDGRKRHRGCRGSRGQGEERALRQRKRQHREEADRPRGGRGRYNRRGLRGEEGAQSLARASAPEARGQGKRRGRIDRQAGGQEAEGRGWARGQVGLDRRRQWQWRRQQEDPAPADST